MAKQVIDTLVAESVEDDTDSKLAQRLAASRKAKEAQDKVEEKEMETERRPTIVSAAAPVDEKELMYIELEKMGCSRSYLAKMKERHGTIIVYPHEDGKWFVVRPLRVKEMKMIREIAEGDPDKLNKEIIESAVAFPRLNEESVSELAAGLPDLLVNMISRLSAFIPVELAFSLSKEL
jgi:hypothetical protein